jgi:hypothetical protein
MMPTHSPRLERESVSCKMHSTDPKSDWIAQRMGRRPQRLTVESMLGFTS